MIFLSILQLFSLFTSAVSNIFNETLGIRNLQLSAATYCDFTSWSCKHCANDVHLIDYKLGDTNVFVARDDVQNATVVAFRGSSDIDNWISNFEFSKISPYTNKNIEVHRGLYNEYLIYKDWLFHTIPKYTDLIITGHSSGGALAMFLAYDYSQIRIPTVYSFGKPRIGNKDFAESADSKIEHYRITHHNDVVPHVPEEILNFRHTNTEIWYPGNDNIYRICEENEDKTCSNSCAPIHCDSISDHLRYIDMDIGGGAC